MKQRSTEEDCAIENRLVQSSRKIYVSLKRTESEKNTNTAQEQTGTNLHNGSELAVAAEVPQLRVIEAKSRRGLLARFAIISEVSDPRQYGCPTKWTITMIVALAAAAAPLGSTIILPVLLPISSDFDVDASITSLSIALFLLAMSIFPLWWSSFSETLGRRTIFILSFALFTIWAVLCAVSQSIAMFIVMRLLSGGASASVQAVGAGTIADLWHPKERGRAMGIFFLGPLCGPLIGPIVGGALAEKFGWRATQWILVTYGGLTSLALILFLPETLPSESSNTSDRGDSSASNHTEHGGKGHEKEVHEITRQTTRQSIQKYSFEGTKVLHRWFIEPLSIILYLQYPAVALTVLYASLTFGSLYFLNVSIQETFSQPPYNFSVLIVGSLYIPNSIGYILASVIGGRWIDRIMAKEARKAGRHDPSGNLVLVPEDRMRENAWLAAILYPGALVWYGWTAEKGLFWLVPVSKALHL